MLRSDKICLITGGTSGIGKAAADRIAATAGKLIIAGRNKHKGDKVVEELRKKWNNENIFFFTVDLSSLKEVREFSEKIHDCCSRIDILINNAGAYFSKYHLTIDGIEASFAVNYLSRFLLTNLLLDLLANSSLARIINNSGEYYRKGDISLKMIQSSGYSAAKAVSNAKLADMVFTMDLAKRLQDNKITVNAFHPGTVATNIINNDPDASSLTKIIYSVVKKLFRNPKEAGEDIYNLAFAEELKDITGKYFVKGKIKKPLDLVYDKEISNKLWKYSEALTGYHSSFFTKKSILDK